MEKRKKELEEFIEKAVNFLVLSGLVLSVFIIMFSSMGFYVGYHNADLGQNIRYLNAEFDLNLVESKVGNPFDTWDVQMSGTDLYALGMQQMKFNNLVMSFGWFLFGVTLIYLFKTKNG